MNFLVQVGAILAVVIGFAIHTCVAAPEQYPQRPLRVICPSPPGGAVDFLSRVVAQALAASFGVSVIVDNRAGASAVIASELLAKSPADGYTLMLGYSSHATNPMFFRKLPYDTLKDFTAIAHMGYIPLLLVVHPSVPAHSVSELIALARARPGQLQFAAGAAGGGPSIAGQLFRYMAGVDIIQVPYKGNAPALIDLLGGRVTMMFDTIATSLAHARSGRLRMLAVTSAQRSSLAPEVLTLSEAGLPGFDVRAWFVVLAPSRTPRDIVAKLNAVINRATSDPDIRSRLSSQGVESVGGSPQQTDAFIRAEVKRWQEIIKAAGMTAD